ncbi:MAG: 4'-phosphopantetheinyl transferase superfamily protein [Pseudomonadota bacterium]
MAAPVSATLWRGRIDAGTGAGGQIALAGVHAGNAGANAANRAALRARLSAVLLPASVRASDVRWPARRAPQAPRPWRLSASRSGPWMVLAATGGSPARAGSCAIGVDVERLRPRNFAALERHLGWSRASVGAEHFYRRWTLAEACFKCGTGSPQVSDLRSALFAALDCASNAPSWGQAYRATLPDGAVASAGWFAPEPGLVVCAVDLWTPANADTDGIAPQIESEETGRNE